MMVTTSFESDLLSDQAGRPGTGLPLGSLPRRDVPPYVQDLYRTSLLTADEEVELFQKLKALKSIQERLLARGMDGVEWVGLERELIATRNRIAVANLRLVASIARKFMQDNQVDFFDLVSEGNQILLRAIELFDVGQGYRFSTYATTALRRHFARVLRSQRDKRQKFWSNDSALDDIESDSTDWKSIELLASEVRSLIKNLSPRERVLVEGRYGFHSGTKAKTFRELSEEIGVSKERARQILARALDKLLVAARQREIEPPA